MEAQSINVDICPGRFEYVSDDVIGELGEELEETCVREVVHCRFLTLGSSSLCSLVLWLHNLSFPISMQAQNSVVSGERLKE